MQDALKIQTAFDQREWYRSRVIFKKLGANQQTDSTCKRLLHDDQGENTSTKICSLLNIFFGEETVSCVWGTELTSCVVR